MKRVLALLLILAMSFSLAACGGKKEEGTDGKTPSETTTGKNGKKDEEVVLRWQQWWSDQSPEGLFQGICDDFYAETGIKVELINEPYADTKTAILAGNANGTIADLVGVTGSWVYEFVNGGVITCLSDLFESDNYDTTNCAEVWQLGGKGYAVPVVTFSYPLFCNLDILEDCGIDPESLKTWSDLREACKVIVEKGYNAIAYNFDTASPSGLTNICFNFNWASGAKSKDENGNMIFEGNDGFRDGIEFLHTLNEDGSVYPGYTTMKEADYTSLFGSGNVAFIPATISMITMWEEESQNLRFTAIPLPQKDGYTGTYYADYACWGLGIAEKSPHKKEAYEFLKFILSPEINTRLAEGKGCFPGSTKADPDFSNTSEVFQKVFEFWKTETPISEFNCKKDATALQSALLEVIDQYLMNDITLDQCMTMMQETADRISNTY